MTWRILPHIPETSNNQSDGWSEDETTESRFAPITRALLLIKPHLGTFILGLAALSLGSAITVGLPEAARLVMESPARDSFLANPVPIAFILTGIFLFQAICVFVRSIAFGSVATKVVQTVRVSYFKWALEESIKTRPETSSIVAARIDSEGIALHDAIATKLPLFIRYGIQTLASLGFMIILSPELSLVATLSVAFLVLAAYALSERLRRSSIEEQSYKAGIVGWAREVIEGMSTVRSFGAEGFVQDRYARRLNKLYSKASRRLRVGATTSAVLLFVNSIGIVIGVSFGISLVGSGRMSWSELATFSVYATILTVSCALCIQGFVELFQCMALAEKLVRNAEKLDQSPPQSSGTSLVPSVGLTVTADNVSYGYGIAADGPVVAGISFAVPAGSTTAIVGPSGAGKSTIVKLLSGFDLPQGGTVAINGVDIEEIPETDIRRAIAWVPHEPTLFSVSIAENLRIAKPDATDDELMSALDNVGLGRLIRQCPEGLETEIGEQGGGLSSGQRQRLALARVFLRKPSLVVLDEATAALDIESETRVHAALRTSFPGVTFIIVSHRLSSIKAADQVIVVESGRIARIVTYDAWAADEQKHGVSANG